MPLFSKRIVSSLLLVAALVCSVATAVMMAASAYALMPVALYGWILGAAAIALDVAHYLSWAWANWLFQTRHWLHGLLFLACGSVIALFSITATSNQMIKVVLGEISAQQAEIDVRKPQIESSIAALQHELSGLGFTQRTVSNEKAIRDDIAATRKEAAEYRAQARFRNAEATEGVADNKEANLAKELAAVDQWNQVEQARVDVKRKEIEAKIETYQAELLRVAGQVHTTDIASEDTLKLLLRAFAVVLVLVPGLIYSSHATNLFGAPAAHPEAPQGQSAEVKPHAQELALELSQSSVEVDQEDVVVLPAPNQAIASIASSELSQEAFEAEVPTDQRDLYESLESEVGQLEAGTPVPVGKMAKALKTSTKRLVRLYDLAGQRGLLVRNEKDHWIVA